MSEATAATGNQKSFSLADILKAQEAINKMRFTDQWTLVAPDGRMWQGMPTDLLQVLMPHHPLLQPMGFGEMEGG